MDSVNMEAKVSMELIEHVIFSMHARSRLENFVATPTMGHPV